MTKKLGRPERAAIALLAGLAATACAAEAEGVARYAADSCRRVALVDQASGELVRGAEDLAYDAARDRLYISAYDRRAVEGAVRRKAFSIPEGGVYAMRLSALIEAKEGPASVAPLVRKGDVPGGLRPHGLTFDPYTDEIIFINRGYQRINGKWRMTTRVERAGANGEVFVGADLPAPCAANNLIEEAGRVMVSFDHGGCGWRAGLEDAIGLKRSGVVDGEGRTLFDRASFANGIARAPDGDIALAATRENALLLFGERAEGLSLQRRVETPGGPDNLTVAEDGAIVAALHPSPLRIALNRKLGVGKAPSRIVRVDPKSGAVDLLFDDPSGAIFSAATVAVERKGVLVAGSVTDSGLLVCAAPSEL